MIDKYEVINGFVPVTIFYINYINFGFSVRRESSPVL